jgi:hypothetical protein
MRYATRLRGSSGAFPACLLLLCAIPVLALAAEPAAPGTVNWVGETQGARYDVLVSGLADGALPSRILLNAADEANCLTVAFPAGEVVLERVFAGKRTELGRAKLPEGFEQRELVLQWRYDRLIVVVKDVELLRAYEHGLVAGKVGFEGDMGKAELLVQPIDVVSFSDDFGRAQASMGDWVPQSGTWANIQSEGQAEEGANPFAFEGKAAGGGDPTTHLLGVVDGPQAPTPPAVALNGQTFWSDYWLEAAARCEGASALGIVVFCVRPPDGQLPDTYLLARWSGQLDLSPTGNRMQLIAVKGGKQTVLAEAKGGFVPEQWYRVRVEASAQRLSVAVDDRRLIDIPNTTGLVRGCLGLYGEGAGGARYDDISAGPLDPGTVTLPTDAPAWRASPGVEATKDGWKLTTQTSPGTVLCPQPMGNVDATLDLRAAGVGGELLLGYRGDQTHWAVTWAEGSTANVRLVRRQGGQEQVLATASVPLEAKAKAVLGVHALDEFFRVQLDGKTVIEAVDDQRLPGGPLAGSEDDPENDPRVGLVGIRLVPGAPAQVASLRLTTAQQTRGARVTEQFVEHTDTMSEWATVAGAWIDPARVAYGNGVFWNKGDYYGDTRMQVTLAGGAGAASLLLGATGYDVASGYRLKAATAPEGLVFALSRGGTQLAQGTLAGAGLPQALRFERRGTLLTLSVGPTLVLQATDPQPLTGPEVGLLSEGIAPDYNASFATSTDLEDYTFSSAPTDWTEQVGTWELTSRWTCSPQWSWWSGRSDETAVMWTKPSFTGDQAVELYVAMKMGMVERAGNIFSYPHPHDANITICGDGTSLASGYSFTVGGGANQRTQIWKGTRLLAETSEPKALLPKLSNGMPDMGEFHRKWWQVRAEKQGEKLRLFLDDVLVLEARDEAPLTGGHVAVWTYQNGIMVARTRVYGPKGESILAPTVTEARAIAAAQPAGRTLPVVTSPTHAALIEGFEEGRGEFQTFRRYSQGAKSAERHGGAEHGATIYTDTDKPASGKQCLRLANENPGGDFGVYALQRDFGPQAYPILGFDYRMGPETKVDVVLRSTTRSYVIQFAGTGETPPGYRKLGRIDGVQPDGLWHHATFDIRAALQDAGIDPAAETITDVLVGYFGNDRQLAIGATGNPRGATWWLDNFGVYMPGPAAGSFQWQPVADAALQRGALAGATRYRSAITAEPLDEPADSAPTSEALAFEAKGLAEGLQYLHVQSLDAEGKVLGTFHSALVVAPEAPVLARTLPAQGVKVSGGRVGLVVGGAPSGIAPDSLKLKIQGTEATLATPGVEYRALDRTVLVDLDRFLEPTPGLTDATIELVAGTTYAGTALAPISATFRVDHSLDTTPPTPPVVTDAGTYLAADNFERGVGKWLPWSGSYAGDAAALVLDGSAAAEGSQSLAIVKAAEVGRYGVWAIPEGFDAGKYRLLSFDYKIPSWVRIDMQLRLADGVPRLLQMTDNDHEVGEAVIASLPIVADDTWRHIEVDLLALLEGALPKQGDYRVARLGFAGGGWDGNPKGTVWNIDNFCLASVAGSADGVHVKWSSRDATGIAGTSYVLDQNPTTEPDTTPDTDLTGLTLTPDMPAGIQWLHLRTVDARGNWSDTTHQRILVDDGPVRVSGCTIADGKRLCIDRFAVTLEDTGQAGQLAGVDPRSIRVRINDDPPYQVDGRTLLYDASNGRLIWDGQRADTPRTFLDGQEVLVALESVSDYAGNPLTPGFSTRFTMDFSKDNAPPDRPKVGSDTHPTAAFDPYESDKGKAEAATGCAVELDTDAVKAPAEGRTGEGLGRSCLRITRTQGDGLAARLFEGYAEVTKTPYLGFDYCCPAGTTLTVQVNIDGRPLNVIFTEPGVQASRKIANAAADGIWRHAALDLADVARDAFGKAEGHALRAVDLVDTGSVETPVGASVWIDNFWITGGGAGSVNFAWKTVDPSGIAGYSWAFDNSPFTVPAEAVTGTATTLHVDSPPSGSHYIHVRALDGAGHWSDATHFAIYQRE